MKNHSKNLNLNLKKKEPQSSISKIDFERDFSKEDLDVLENLNLTKPNSLPFLSDNYLKELIEVTQDNEKYYRGKIRGLSNKKNKTEEDIQIIKDFENKKIVMDKYLKQIRVIKDTKQRFQTGTGIYHNNPRQLLHRLDLLIGSILAGNNGVIPEFLQIIHILNKNKWITKEQLNNLIKGMARKYNYISIN